MVFDFFFDGPSLSSLSFPPPPAVRLDNLRMSASIFSISACRAVLFVRQQWNNDGIGGGTNNLDACSLACFSRIPLISGSASFFLGAPVLVDGC